MPDLLSGLEQFIRDFHFLRPWWWLALILLLYCWWQLRRQTKSAGLWESVCDPELLPYVTEQPTTGRVHHLPLMFAVTGILLIAALAGPTWERVPTPVFRAQSALVIVLDLSRSMNATDIKPSRLKRAKFKISDILRLRKDGQTALVVFADQPFVVTPLTNDVQTIENQLPALSAEIMPSQGSNLEEALTRASELLIQAGIAGGDILVLSDAVSGDATVGVEITQKSGARISVIAVGTPEGAPVPDDTGGFISDGNGNVVVMSVDLVGLRNLAEAGNGLFTTITSDNRDVERYVQFIDRMDTQRANTASDLFTDRWQEFGPWLLLLCLPFAALAFRRGVLSLLITTVLVSQPNVSHAANWFKTPDQQGIEAFEAGRYGDAKSFFENPEWRASSAYREGDFAGAAESLGNLNNPQAQYNKGNALARLGELESAIAAYRETLAAMPDHEDAKYNKELLEKLLEQQQQQNQGEGENDDNNEDAEQGGESEGEGQQAKDSDQQGNSNSRANGEMNDDQLGEEPEVSGDEAKPPSDNEAQQEENSAQQEKPEEPPSEPNEQQMAELESQTETDAELDQATEQWLRQIPDDPGGLLRRKFEYEYRKRGARQSSRGQAW